MRKRPFGTAGIKALAPLALAIALLGPAGEALAAPLSQQKLPGEGSLPYLFFAYLITWAVFFGYAVVMSRRQRELERQVRELRQALEEREKKGQKGQ